MNKDEYNKQYYASNAQQVNLNRLKKRVRNGATPTKDSLNKFGVQRLPDGSYKFPDGEIIKGQPKQSNDSTANFTLTKRERRPTQREAPERNDDQQSNGSQESIDQNDDLPDIEEDSLEASFTLSDAGECLNKVGTIADNTIKNYLSRLRVLIKAQGLPKDTLISEAFNDPKRLIRAINKKTTSVRSKKDYYSLILSLKKYCPEFGEVIQPEVLEAYRKEMNKFIKKSDKITEENTEVEVFIDWRDVLKKVPEIIKKYGRYSDEHLLALLYTEIPPLRDNFGRIAIGDKNKTKRDGFLSEDFKNLTLEKFKTVKTFGVQKIKMPTKVVNAISKRHSLLESPSWLFENNKGGPQGYLSTKVKEIFDAGIIDLRHSKISHELGTLGKISMPQRKKLADAMLHSVATQLKYLRQTGRLPDSLRES